MDISKFIEYAANDYLITCSDGNTYCKFCGMEVQGDEGHAPDCLHLQAIDEIERPTFESSSLTEAYLDRNLAVQALARLAGYTGYNIGIKPDDKWPILYIDLPTGQASWHIKADDLIDRFPDYEGEWDGHTLDEKRQRLIDFIKYG